MCVNLWVSFPAREVVELGDGETTGLDDVFSVVAGASAGSNLFDVGKGLVDRIVVGSKDNGTGLFV